MGKTEDKIRWLIPLLGSLEYGLQISNDIRKQGLFEEGKKVRFSPDWRMIQQYLMPDILLVMMEDITVKEDRFQVPGFIVIPSWGEMFPVTTDEQLDVLNQELADFEQGDDDPFLEIESKVREIREKNSRAKAHRLLSELKKSLGINV